MKFSYLWLFIGMLLINSSIQANSSQSGYIGDQGVLYGSPQAAADSWCVPFRDYFDEQIPDHTVEFLTYTVTETSTQTEERHYATCIIGVRGYYSNGMDWVIGNEGGRSIYYHACKPPTRSFQYSTYQYGCYIECDNGSLEGKMCPPQIKNDCTKGQGKTPINFLTGNKLFTEVDYDTGGVNRLHFTRTYNSQSNKVMKTDGSWVDPELDVDYFRSFFGRTLASFIIKKSNLLAGYESPLWARETVFHEINDAEGNPILIERERLYKRVRSIGAIDSVWKHNFDKAIFRTQLDFTTLKVFRPDGNEYTFQRTDSTNTLYLPTRISDSGVEKIIASETGYAYYLSNLDVEIYDIEGRYTKLQTRTGYIQNMVYDSDGLLIEVNDNLGRSITFVNDALGRIISMTTPDGYEFTYEYYPTESENPLDVVNGLIRRVYYPDGDENPLNNPYREFLYEDSRFPNAVTGINENEQTYGVYVYDSQGRAIYSGLANGAQGYSVNFDVPGQTTVTNSFGKNTVYHYDASDNLITIVGEPSTNCLGDSRNFTYNSNNFLTSETDKNGNITTYVRDSKGREISRTEAAGTAFARTISTEWHPSINVKTKVIEPERVTDYTYDANGLLINQVVTPNPGQ